MAIKKKIEQTDILPESQTIETATETTDSEEAETTEQPIETKGSENGGKIETPGGDSEETKVTPPTESETTEKTVTMTLRHKSHTPHYHRCGLTLTKMFSDYEVREDYVKRIKSDKWIEVKDSK